MAGNGIRNNWLAPEDFPIPVIDIHDTPRGPEVVWIPLTPMDILPLRRHNPEWIARYTPVLDRMNEIMRNDRMSPFHMKAEALKMRLKELRAQRGPTFDALAAKFDNEINGKMDDIAKDFGTAVHTSDPYLSYLLLYRLLNAGLWNLGLAAYDDTIARAEEARALRKQKNAPRKSSVGEPAEMKAEDIELPYGEHYHEQMRERALTAVERAQRQQAAAGYDTGHPAPTLPAPHPSDAGTVRHFGPTEDEETGGAGGGADEAGMSGSGMSRSRGDEWHRGQNRRYV